MSVPPSSILYIEESRYVTVGPDTPRLLPHCCGMPISIDCYLGVVCFLVDCFNQFGLSPSTSGYVAVGADTPITSIPLFPDSYGIAIGIKYGTPLSYLMAFAATLLGCILLAIIRPPRDMLPQEAVIGIMYAAALVACLLLADKLTAGATDLKNTLQGSMTWVSWPLVLTTCTAYAVLSAFHFRFRNTIIAFTNNPQLTTHRRRWDFLFFLSQGIITILIVPVAGVLLAYGFLMVPAAIGLLFSRNWKTSLIVGWLAGFAACTCGLIISYRTDSPYGPSLLLAMGTTFLTILVFKLIKTDIHRGGGRNQV